MTYRIEYLACRIDAAAEGWESRSRQRAGESARRIAAKLFGPSPARKPGRLSDLMKGMGHGA